jgi:hypothetical protein
MESVAAIYNPQESHLKLLSLTLWLLLWPIFGTISKFLYIKYHTIEPLKKATQTEIALDSLAYFAWYLFIAWFLWKAT